MRAAMVLIILVPWILLTREYRKLLLADIRWLATLALVGGLNQAPYFF